MSIGSIIYTLLIGPLNLIFDAIFTISNRIVSNPGYAIIILSLSINLLILPLYNRADKLQKEQRELEARIRPGIDHIRKTFKGEERFMMLQTYYRQNKYSPSSSLKGSFSLLLQIPFFMSAYRLLSGLSILKDQSFWIIKDLGSPDGLINLGFISINVLPILMTLINLISGEIYTKDLKFKDKIQIYVMALLFLVLLYNSPSGLAFYWTLNNVFSLGKNIVKSAIAKRKTIENKAPKKVFVSKYASRVTVFLSFLGIAVITGLYIPATLLSSSPIEFVVASDIINPNCYLFYSLAYSIGLFVLWIGLIYTLATDRIKEIMTCIAPALFLSVTLTYFYYQGAPGKFLNNLAFFPQGRSYPLYDRFWNAVMLLFFICATTLLVRYFRKVVNSLLLIVVVTFVISSFKYVGITNDIYADHNHPESTVPEIQLSTTDKNVVVIMIDRAVGFRFPDIIELEPELLEAFEGFTYYPNTVSYGAHTNIAAPALWGGYEYIPQISNRRYEIPLEEKHNESLTLMPRIFADNGYHVSFINPPYAGYQEIPDISIFDGYDNIDAYYPGNALNPYGDLADADLMHVYTRNLFCYGVSRSCLISLTEFIADDGFYLEPEPPIYAVQKVTSSTEAYGYDYKTSKDYSVLDALPEITHISDNSQGGVLMLSNTLPHDSAILSEPGYSVEMNVNNTDNLIGSYLGGGGPQTVGSFHLNIASLKLLGEWFDYLRANNCYDNTRIIVVADHGYSTNKYPGYNINSVDNLGYFRPLLLVKDFDSHEFTISDEFMTNADTPTIAFSNLIDEPINPYTNNVINNDYKFDNPIIVSNSHLFSVRFECGTIYRDQGWFLVKDGQNLNDSDDWVYYERFEDIPR